MGLLENSRELVRAYLTWRRARGHDGFKVLGEHPLEAWIEINIWIAELEPAHRDRPDEGYQPSHTVKRCLAALEAFYAALSSSDIRTAGDPFTAMQEFRAEVVHDHS